MKIINRIPQRIENGIAFVGNSYFKFFRIKPFSYSDLSVRDRRAAWQRRSLFFQHVQKPNLHGQLYRIERSQDWEHELNNLVKQAPSSLQAAAKHSIDIWVEWIELFAKANYDWVLALEFEVGNHEPMMSLKESFKVTIRELLSFLGFEPEGKDYVPTEIEAILQAGKEKEDDVGHEWLLEPMKDHEIYEFYQHHYNRGFSKTPLPEAYRKDWPVENSRYIPDAEIEEKDGFLIIRKPGQQRFVSCIVPAMLPNLSKPKEYLTSELFIRLTEDLPFPVDMTFHWRQMSNEEAMEDYAIRQAQDVADKIKYVTKSKVESRERHFKKNQVEAILPDLNIQGQDQELEITKRYHEIQELYRYLKETNAPMLEAHMVFIVYGISQEELEKRIRDVIRKLKDYDIVALNPIGEQRMLFESWFPSRSWSGIGYTKRLIPEAAAQLTMMGADQIIGDKKGIPIGVNRLMQPVFVNLPGSIQRDKNGSWFISGDQGAGKSTLLNVLAYWAVQAWGALVAVWDLKHERSHWVQTGGKSGLPGVGHLVERFVLDGREQPGLLDPFRWIKDPAKAKQNAISLIDQMLAGDKEKQFDRQMALWEAGAKIGELSSTEPSMEDLRKALKQSAEPMAKRLADFMGYCSDYPIGKLIFGKGAQVDLPQSGILLIQPEGIDLPKKREPENISQSLSLAVINSLAIFTLETLFATKNWSLGQYDESWSFLQRAAGQMIIDKQNRLSRSHNVSIMFASQSALDMPSHHMDLISTFVCMGTNTEEETDCALRYLKTSPDNEIVREELKSIAADRPEEGEERLSSRGYMRDAKNHHALVEFIIPDPELREFFLTRPKNPSLVAG